MTLTVIAFTVAVIGITFGIRCYVELWRWAKQCQNARIVVGHKKRVQIDAPLVDWLAWANQLNDDQKGRGRIVYRNGYTAVAIMRPDAPVASRAMLRRIRQTINARRSRNAPAPPEPAREKKAVAA